MLLGAVKLELRPGKGKLNGEEECGGGREVELGERMERKKKKNAHVVMRSACEWWQRTGTEN